MRKRNTPAVLAGLVVYAVLLTGCGGSATSGGNADNSRAASEGAVSASAVSGGAVSEDNIPETENRMEQRRYCTDTNLYLSTEDGIVQCRLDGTHKKKLTTATDDIWYQVEYTEDDWLYYTESDGDEETSLYRVPIEKDTDGYDVVKLSEREKLLQDGVSDFCYLDSDYCLYTKEGEVLVKFDMRTKKKVSEDKYFVQDDGSDVFVFRMGDTFVCIEEDSSLAYTQAVDDTEWQSFKCQQGERYVQMPQAGTSGAGDVYYSQCHSGEAYGRAVNRIDVRRREGVPFVTEEELKEEIGKATGIGEEKEALGYFRIISLFTQQERIYLMAEAGWEKESAFYMENLIFSKGRGDSHLRYERELTETMHSHKTACTGKWVDSQYWKKIFRKTVVYDDASCVRMVDGKAYLFCYDNEKDKARVGCYELATGRFWWIQKNDADFMALFYDYYDEDFEDIFDELTDGNDFCGLTGCPPEDKESVGVFMEE